MKSIRLLIILLLLLTQSTGFVSWGKYSDSDSYFPMKTNNKWTFHTIANNTNYWLSIGDDTIIDTEKYHIVEYCYQKIKYKRYYVLIGENLFMRESPSGKNYLYLPSSDSIGKTFNVYENGISSLGKIIAVNDSVKVPTGKEFGLLNLQFEYKYNDQVIIKNYFFKKGVGIIAIKQNGSLQAYLIQNIIHHE